MLLWSYLLRNFYKLLLAKHGLRTLVELTFDLLYLQIVLLSQMLMVAVVMYCTLNSLKPISQETELDGHILCPVSGLKLSHRQLLGEESNLLKVEQITADKGRHVEIILNLLQFIQ